ncbi:MAG: potassium transporter [Methylococcales bacterium]|mgnify:CR=1 FL=1|jgi:Trk K+ transport system NAD-binding subunit|nr:potassium transporter [Methylococcales bacterium]MBT3815028.1 potassium transporter [Methylococcales bacterium]MBT4031410.1 potassium transporter [Methylococcales bacterium]MBT4347585.1 potassium transporter [Methylococcales bacterium]MBT4599497.1 potassium transporter [Methylococcales bacterium]
MAATVDLSRVIFIVLREMRKPILAIIIVYSLSIVGMVIIPGPVVDGKAQYLSIFHAFYFMTYTATTTGFGEIPFPFSNAQRFWAIVCLYISVITWFYAIGSIIRLVQNPYLGKALAEHDFSNKVERISGDFFIICGFGDTGSVLARGLSDARLTAVIIDSSEERIKALQLRDYKVPMPGLFADASVPKHLIEAGIRRADCKAIVSVTSNEETNLKISAMARILNPGIDVITKSKVEIWEETLATIGGKVHIIDPFKTYAQLLAFSIVQRYFYSFNNWLVGDKSTELEQPLSPPNQGLWIICGFGRMGQEIKRALNKQGLRTAIIDPKPISPDEENVEKFVLGLTTVRTLKLAGIEQAVGIVTGTDDDGQNVSILLNARSINPNVFTVVRQNSHENFAAFQAAKADMVMQPSLVAARRIMLLLKAPLLKPFFKYFLVHQDRDHEMNDVISWVKMCVGDGDKVPPLLTSFDITDKNAKVLMRVLENDSVQLGDLLKDPRNRTKPLDLVALVVQSDEGKVIILPGSDYLVKAGDQLLLCGTDLGYRLFLATVNNEYKLYHVRTGLRQPRSFFMQWYVRKMGREGL